MAAASSSSSSASAAAPRLGSGIAKETTQETSNPSGIPTAPFIVSLALLGAPRLTQLLFVRNTDASPRCVGQTDVEEFLGGPDEEVEPTLVKFRETMS